MNYTRPIDAVAYRKKLEENISHVKTYPGQYVNPDEVIDGLEIAIAELGDMPTMEPDDSFQVVYHFGPDGKSKIVSKVYDIDRERMRFLVVDGWNKFWWVSTDKCQLFEGWENYQEE